MFFWQSKILELNGDWQGAIIAKLFVLIILAI